MLSFLRISTYAMFEPSTRIRHFAEGITALIFFSHEDET